MVFALGRPSAAVGAVADRGVVGGGGPPRRLPLPADVRPSTPLVTVLSRGTPLVRRMHKARPTIEPVQNPLAYIAQRWTPAPQTVRRAALAAVVMSVVIVVTGGAVRLTGSGLGCDTWPKCTDDSLFATPEQGIHGAIEFGNRMLTYVLSAAVGWAIIAARSAKPLRRGLTRLAWSSSGWSWATPCSAASRCWAGLNPRPWRGTSCSPPACSRWPRSPGSGPARATARPARASRAGAQAVLGARRRPRALLIALGTVGDRLRQARGDSSDVPRMPCRLGGRRTRPRDRRLGRLRAGRRDVARAARGRRPGRHAGPRPRPADRAAGAGRRSDTSSTSRSCPRPWSAPTCSAPRWCGSRWCGSR